MLGAGANLIGYYMYHGGVNPDGKYSTLQESKATGYANDLPVKSYDFQTCLRENGLPSESYYRLRKHHAFIKIQKNCWHRQRCTCRIISPSLRVRRTWRRCGQPSVIIKRRTAGSYLSIITRENGNDGETDHTGKAITVYGDRC